MLRMAEREDSPLGRMAQAYTASGHLVPDDLMYDLVERALNDCGFDRFVLDGFPRTLAQARWLSAFLAKEGRALHVVIFLDLADEMIIARLSRRRVHKVTGESFHLDARPPVGVDPALIIQRADDRPESVVERLHVYRRSTQAVADYFRERGDLRRVPAAGTFDAVHDRIIRVLYEP